MTMTLAPSTPNVPPLFEHQQRSLDILHAQPRIFDASDPGTGKTRVAIEAFAHRRARGGGKALVLAPKSLLRAAWEHDCRRFAPTLRTSVAFAEHRDVAFRRDADVYITNHDATTWLARQKQIFFQGFDTLIVDEVGAFKHHTSQRSKALNKIKKFFQYRLVMNGVVTPNSITDIWNQMNVLDDGARLGTSFFNFRAATCVPKQVGPQPNMIKWEDRPGAADAVAKMVADITIRHKFEDCIDIPPNHEYAVPYYLAPKQLKAYAEMETSALATLGPTAVVSAVNAAAVATKLLQIASGAVYEDPQTYHLIDTGRYEMVMDLVEERDYCVVFFLWRHQKEQLMAEAEKRGITYCLIDGTVSDRERSQAVDYFQRGLYKMILAHPASAAHGLTLTRGTSTIWASPTYNLEHYQQGLKRIHRAGQVLKTETIVIVAPDTIDERAWHVLQTKRLMMADLLGQLTQAAA
jgi:SNF2 family DNA or RNA helicase